MRGEADWVVADLRMVIIGRTAASPEDAAAAAQQHASLIPDHSLNDRSDALSGIQGGGPSSRMHALTTHS